MKRPEWKVPDWLTWPIVISIVTIVGGGFTSGGRALWVFAANEKVQGLTIPAAGVGILALGLYTYFLVTKPSVLAALGAMMLAIAFGLLSFYYCGFTSLFRTPMQDFANLVMALLPEMAMVLGGVALGLALRAARREREERERKAADAAQSEQENGWRLLEQENEQKRLANERYELQTERKRLLIEQPKLTMEKTEMVSISVQGKGKQKSKLWPLFLMLIETEPALTERQIAERLACSPATAHNLKVSWREKGEIT